MKDELLNKGKQKFSKQSTRDQSWKWALNSLVLVLVVVFGFFCIVATGGSSGSSSSISSTPATSGYELPTKVSAVPTSDEADAAAYLSFRGKLHALALLGATDPGTDYSEAVTDRWVEEHALEQFAIVEEVLGALAQTHYSDAGNIGNGPYKCMVAWEEESNGHDIKQLQPWIVRSDNIQEDGQDVLRIRAWIEEVDQGEIFENKAEFKIYSPATKKDDGSYQDFGVWTMNVKFDDDGNDFFAASASIGDNGEAILKIQEQFPEGFPGSPVQLLGQMKAVMYRSDTEGYGKVYYPNFEALFGPDSDPELTELPHVLAQYAYNETYLAVREGDNDVMYKDRASVTEMTHRYGVYNADTGADVTKGKSFGFPIRFTLDGISQHAYYGAYQGRHEIWMQGQAAIPVGTEVTREDMPPDQAETYTVGKTFPGTFTKRTLVDASVEDVKDIPVEIWINSDYNLVYKNNEWKYCPQMIWNPPPEPPTCAVALKVFDDEIGFESLIVGANDDRKHVHIGRWDQDTQQNLNYVYLAASEDNYGAGFYKATQEGEHGKLIAITPFDKLDPQEDMQLWVNTGGSIFVEYKAVSETYPTGWVEKEVVGFNTMTWMPEFSEDGDKPYTLPLNKELYINMQGANYIVKRIGDNDYYTKLELQTAANPTNATTVVPAGRVFKDQWNPDGSSTYEFITDAEDDNYLLLVYKTIGDNDKDAQGQLNQGVAVGAVVARGIWGLEAYLDGEATGIMYNWEYSTGGSGWGSMTYLVDDNGDYKLLDDPMRFDAITVTNNGGDEKTVSLMFDGWMGGLPMMYHELCKNGWVMTEKISNKIINLAEGTELIETSTGDSYLLKPLEISQFLNLVEDTTGLDVPDISQADDVDLATVPDFVEHGMGDKPDVDTIKYSEGELVE